MFSGVPKPKKRFYMSVLAVGTIIAIVSLGAAEIYFDYYRTWEAAFSRLENLARIADENISGRLRALDVMLADAGRESQSVDTPEEEQRFLASLKGRAAAFDEIRSISVSDSKGIITLTTLPELKGFDSSQRPYYTTPLRAQEAPALVLTGPLLSATGATVLFASRPKPPVEREWDGVVLASLPPAYFAQTLGTIRPDPGGYAALLGRSGTIIARWPGQEQAAGRSLAATPEHVLHLAGSSPVSRAVLTENGGRSLQVTRTTLFPDLLVRVGWSEEVVLEEWHRAARIKGGALLLLTVLGLAVLRRLFRHEQELTAQRNLAESLIETANVMVIGLDAGGVIRIFNASAERISGFQKKEVLGHSIFLVLSPRATPETHGPEGFSALRIGIPLRHHFLGSIQTRSGQTRLISWQNSRVSAESDYIIAFGIDVTERIEAEQKGLASQRFIQAITDNMPGMVGYWDQDLRCRFANRSYLEWFGKSPEAILGRTMLELMGKSLFAKNEPYIRAALRGEKQSFERTLVKPSGEVGYTWAHYIPDQDAAGTVAGFFVLVTDVTPLKQAENRLRSVSQRLSLATRAGGIGVWDYDLASGRLVWDEQMLRIYGVPADEAANLTYDVWQRHCHPDDRERIEAAIRAAQDGGQEFDVEYRICRTDGSQRTIHAAGTFEHDAEGRPSHMIGVNWDITAARESAQALADAKAVAERANRAKSDFLANMSHEIRTPLNAVLGLTHLLERSELSEEQRDLIQKIKTSGRSLLSIINDILDFSKIEAGKLELEAVDFNLSDVLDSLATMMAANASSKDLELVVGMDQDVPPRLSGDALRLQQVLINLVSNAIKFTLQGHVVVHAEPAGWRDGRHWIAFSVADTGIGIAEDTLASLFNAFSQADTSTTRRFGGTGLGLAISQRLIAQMGGEITVSSAPGVGSTFRFTLPFDPPLMALPAPTSLERLSVLIAEDHAIARTVLAETAATLGWYPQTVENGRAAVEETAARLTQGKPFDVLLLDWQMPEMDGLTASQEIRALSAMEHAPLVIMVTALRREALLQMPGAEVLDAVLTKPVSGSALFNAVSKARAKRLAQIGSSASAASAVPPEASAPLRLPGCRLLLVEDNAINQEVARQILSMEGAQVTVRSDGRQAVDLVAQTPEAFDAVLMDIQMPVMDGREATQYIRQHLRRDDLPIIALTAGALSTEREQAFAAGMNAFVTKPFDIDQMVAAIQTCLRAQKRPGTGT